MCKGPVARRRMESLKNMKMAGEAGVKRARGRVLSHEAQARPQLRFPRAVGSHRRYMNCSEVSMCVGVEG